ncbi:hypothetical protein GCM10010389_32540 [Streptomyces echinoruber]|uniref:Uncharacterized protein n=1 Tax=Streptomyces echinoruber TaxID=68898 RepID=A0A918RCC4_9ACTN|nr:hypothetical protein GCM10010389_32540 [Streptomyces echinoruber]
MCHVYTAGPARGERPTVRTPPARPDRALPGGPAARVPAQRPGTLPVAAGPAGKLRVPGDVHQPAGPRVQNTSQQVKAERRSGHEVLRGRSSGGQGARNR